MKGNRKRFLIIVALLLVVLAVGSLIKREVDTHFVEDALHTAAGALLLELRAAGDIDSETMREVFTLTTRLILAFGAGFEMPVVVFFLAVSGIVTPRQLLGGFKYAVLVSFVMAAVLTPPDVISQVMLAVPLLVLYLLGVGVAYVFAPKKREENEIAVSGEGAS